MRYAVLLVALILAPSVAEAKDCPSNAVRASTDVWSAGSIPPGRTLTKTHPCGRQLKCTGGIRNDIWTRRCYWQ
jgi:hypothetical protein